MKMKWKSIKKVKSEFPTKGLRIRRVDNGPRFVIVGALEEDDKILAELSNDTYYAETNQDPFEDYIDEIKFWTAEKLENEDID